MTTILLLTIVVIICIAYLMIRRKPLISLQMPARSQAQRRYLHHKFGRAWTKRHHYDNPGKLPKRARGKKR